MLYSWEKAICPSFHISHMAKKYITGWWWCMLCQIYTQWNFSCIGSREILKAFCPLFMASNQLPNRVTHDTFNIHINMYYTQYILMRITMAWTVWNCIRFQVLSMQIKLCHVLKYTNSVLIKDCNLMKFFPAVDNFAVFFYDKHNENKIMLSRW